MEMRIREDRFITECVFRINGISKGFNDTNKQPTFSMGTGDYINGRADKNWGIRKTVIIQGSRNRKENQKFIY
jgi:hypothetical protein